jgi:GNAT superfamily N-acetyltransferase
VSQIRMITFGSEEYQKMVALRDEMLRRPLGLHFTPEYLQQEIDDMLIGCYEKSNEEEILIGCCVLSPVDENTIQLRQMAVHKNFQGTGTGKAILSFAEKVAKQHGYTLLMMHARKVAVGFYEQSGYKIYGDEFLEVSIPHFEMRKQL